jgi:hypothetical protein
MSKKYDEQFEALKEYADAQTKLLSTQGELLGQMADMIIAQNRVMATLVSAVSALVEHHSREIEVKSPLPEVGIEQSVNGTWRITERIPSQTSNFDYPSIGFRW